MSDETDYEEPPFDPYPWDVGYIASYALPATSIPSAELQKLPRWTRRFIGADLHAARSLLDDRWSTIHEPAVARIRDRLLRLQPGAIVIGAKRGWLRLDDPEIETANFGASRYLEAPLPPQIIGGELERLGLSDNAILREFLGCFSGLSEHPSVAGDFVFRAPWPKVSDAGIDDLEGYHEWKDSLCLYHASNGDQVVVHASGRTDWWIYPERRIEERWTDVGAFLDFVAGSLDWRQPLDSYGLP